MVGLQSGNSPLKFGKGGGGVKKSCRQTTLFRVVPPGIEPGTQGFSVLCSTN